MKVGILSLTSGYNFGGTLQTIALSKIIQTLGHEPIVIDYWPTPPKNIPLWRGWGLMNESIISNVRRRLFEIKYLPSFKDKYDKFKTSRLDWTDRCYDSNGIKKVIKNLDAIVVGSDQVWNLKYHPDSNYYLGDFDDYRGKRISYAACCGNPSQGCPEWAAKALLKFDNLTVRNPFTADWVRRCTNNKAQPITVCDPTLLIDDYPKPQMELPDRYIAAYLIGDDNGANHNRTLRQLRQRYGNLPVLCIMPTGFAICIREWYDKILWNLDPYEWIDVIKNASVVYTDSFHAVLFAMRNQIPFIATYTEAVRAPRLLDLKLRYNLNDCIQKASDVEILNTDIDWDIIKESWVNDRDNSLCHLQSIFDL
ncbi:MAG: polysaccharide pyruvyl transferase family protein [Verrucomicrobia bacterium]|nr:MAG: polysaccharide pyruvyl transferase family protein [Verrucomicrobiota bacterium]